MSHQAKRAADHKETVAVDPNLTPSEERASEIPVVTEDLNRPIVFNDQEVERLWQRLQYEGSQHTNRVNFYLVAQSMFFAAFAGNQRDSFYFPLVCVIAGVITSLVWMQMARDQDVIVKQVRSLLRVHCRDYASIVGPTGRRVTQRLLSVHLPLIMMVLWLVAGFGDLLRLFKLWN